MSQKQCYSNCYKYTKFNTHSHIVLKVTELTWVYKVLLHVECSVFPSSTEAHLACPPQFFIAHTHTHTHKKSSAQYIQKVHVIQLTCHPFEELTKVSPRDDTVSLLLTTWASVSICSPFSPSVTTITTSPGTMETNLSLSFSSDTTAGMLGTYVHFLPYLGRSASDLAEHGFLRVGTKETLRNAEKDHKLQSRSSQVFVHLMSSHGPPPDNSSVVRVPDL